MLPHHLNTSEHPYAQTVEDLSLAGLITPDEARDILTQPRLFEEHS